ncbi:MAG: hypothetical protein ACO32J_03400 [Phycisphaerales bacterium]|jgi:hypothetical protein
MNRFAACMPLVAVACIAGTVLGRQDPAPATVPTQPAERPAPVVIHETATVASPLPTVAPAFGNVLGFSGDDLIVSGAVISRSGGADGQVATFVPQSDGTWKAGFEMPQVSGLRPGDFTLQRLGLNADTLVTPITRKTGSSELAWFARTDTPQVWRQMGFLQGPPGERRMNFGGAIAMHGQLLAVSEVSVRPNMQEADHLRNPKVYVFERTADGWKAGGTVERDPSRKPWWFGASLALDGDRLAVGYPTLLKPFRAEQNFASLESPMVCVYRREGGAWTLEQEIQSRGISPFLGFGHRVALRGDLMAVQSIHPLEEGVEVVVLRRVDGTWKPDGLLRPGAGVKTGRGFGMALEISGARVIVGDVSAVEGDDESGRVFVFERQADGWVEAARLAPKAACGPRSFGTALAVRGPWLAVGQVRNENAGVEPGGAYLFRLDE